MTEVGAEFAGLAERLIDATDWGSYRQLDGVSAADVGQVLMSLLKLDPERVDTAEDSLENRIAPQANLYSAAEPAVSVLAAALADPRPRWVRITVPGTSTTAAGVDREPSRDIAGLVVPRTAGGRSARWI